MTTNENKAAKLIAEAAELLGWQIVFDNNTDDVRYIILVQPEEADNITEKLEK